MRQLIIGLCGLLCFAQAFAKPYTSLIVSVSRGAPQVLKANVIEYSTTAHDDDRKLMQLRILSGKTGSLFFEKAIPTVININDINTAIEYLPLITGFEITPTLINKKQVLVKLTWHQARRDRLVNSDLSKQQMRTESTVPLNTWVQVAGANNGKRRNANATVYSTEDLPRERENIYIKINKALLSIYQK